MYVLLLALGCNNDDLNLPVVSACNVENPIEDLEWLRGQITELKKLNSDLTQYFFIEQAEYQNETIFISNNCCPFCNTIVPMYNCSGDNIGLFGDENFNSSTISNRAIIFRSSDFGCEID